MKTEPLTGTIRPSGGQKSTLSHSGGKTFPWEPLFEALHVPALFIAAGNGLVLKANRRFEELSGLGRSDVEHKRTWMEILETGQGASLPSELFSAEGHEGNHLCQLPDGRGGRKDVLISLSGTPEGSGLIITLTDVTPLTAAADALEESERKFRALFEKSGDGIILFDGRLIIDLNPAALEMMGCSDKNMLLGLRPSDISPERQPDGALSTWKEREIAALAYNRGPLKFEWVHRRAGGEEFPVEVVLTPIPMDGKRIFYCALKDLTERKKAEERLLFTKFAVDQAKDSIFWIGRDGRFVYVNEAACLTSGYSMDELLSMTVPDLDPSFAPDGWEAHWNIKRNLSSMVFESMHRRKDGTLCPVEISSRYLKFGSMEYTCAMVRDISERKAGESALRQSEERFRQLFEQNEEALIIFRSGTIAIVDVNPAAVDLYRYTRNRMIKYGPSLFLARPDLIRLRELMSGIGDTGSFSLDNITTTGKDGRNIRVNIRAKTISLSEGDLVYCTFLDITEKARLEEEAALLHSKLIHANKMTSLGVLVSSVAHEVNNPNNFIMFNASLLTDAWRDALSVLSRHNRENGEFSLGGLPFSEMKDVVPKLLQGVSEGARRIKLIVDNLKDFARQDNAVTEAPVDMNKVVSDSVSMLASQIKRHTRAFSLDLAAYLPPVKGSYQQLEQVVINLIMNALQALPGKDRAVTVSTKPGPGEGYILITITDEGTGMSKEVMKKIMEPFFTTKLDTGGTGLGLSISYSIIKEHGGSMAFESAPGKGTKATVTLPVLHDLL